MHRFGMTIVLALPLLADINTDRLLIGTGYNCAAEVGRGNCVYDKEQQLARSAWLASFEDRHRRCWFVISAFTPRARNCRTGMGSE